jgi:hypothetical protein
MSASETQKISMGQEEMKKLAQQRRYLSEYLSASGDRNEK